MIDRAIMAAVRAHAGQTRHDGVEPYIHHPLRVMAGVLAKTGDPEFGAIAVLHDVVEDTELSVAVLRGAFGHSVADAVDALTRRPRVERYFEFIERAALNMHANLVKQYDIHDNYTTANASMRVRYDKALSILRGAM